MKQRMAVKAAHQKRGIRFDQDPIADREISRSDIVAQNQTCGIPPCRSGHSAAVDGRDAHWHEASLVVGHLVDIKRGPPKGGQTIRLRFRCNSHGHCMARIAECCKCLVQPL